MKGIPVPRLPRECENCGTSFVPPRPWEGPRYCSRRCANVRPTTGLVRDRGRLLIVCRDGTRVAYYRGVVAAHIGRLLTSDEHVHHVNGDAGDDRIENLQVVTASAHMSLHQPEIQAGRR
jgi:hypothetical protein